MIVAGVARNNRLYAHKDGVPCKVPDSVRRLAWKRLDGEVRLLVHQFGREEKPIQNKGFWASFRNWLAS